MDKLQLLKFIDNPSSIDKAALPKIVSSIKKYPYCQSIQLLLVKHLYDVKSSHFESQLSKGSIYAGNREHLHNVIYGKVQERKDSPSSQTATSPTPTITKTVKVTPNIAVPKEEISTPKPTESNVEVEKYPPRTTSAKPETSVPKKHEPVAAKKDNTNNLDADEKKRKLQEQIKQRLAEISNKKTDDNPDEKKKSEQGVNNSNDLIDKFIEKEPRIVRKPENEIPEGDLSKESSENKNFISETLAHIYYKQGKHEKAIETYEKLILKFPEKSTYFANQIEQIKQSLK